MKKDVIYIDTEDDITAIIDKVKHANASIVALVPPKRVGVLQSTVNLKLLTRAADEAKKRVVLITNDPALTALASGLSLPIAKNLQSKPEIAAAVPLDTDDQNIIEGSELERPNTPIKGASSEVEETSDKAPVAAGMAATALEKTAKPAKAAGLALSIPNFNLFRKKLFLFSALGLLLLGFLIWALVFAPRAAVAITARTNIVNINKSLQLKSNATLDVTQGVMPLTTKQVKKTTSVEFQPTGKKEVGETAKGTVKFTTNTITSLGTIPAGTVLTSSGGKTFTTDSSVTLTSSNAIGGATTAMTASGRGAAYNGASGSMSGAPSGVSATIVGTTEGGTDKTVTVVSADDIAKATEQLKTQDANTVKDELAKQFVADEIAIDEAYMVETGAAAVAPALDQEATAAKVTVETTYTLLGIKRADLKSVYDAYLATQLKGDSSQKVYASGENATQFSSFQKIEGGFSLKAVGVAQVGPNINSEKVAESVKNKQVGEVKQLIGAIQGVENVEVNLSPFWVNRVPGDVSHITVSFVIKDDAK